jgi:DNA-binding MarR family transcriptional regulator
MVTFQEQVVRRRNLPASASNWSCELPLGESSRPFGPRPPSDDVRTDVPATGHSIGDDDLLQAVHQLRALILAAEHYRQAVALAIGLGITETQAITSLALHGELGQSALARDLQLTSSASTALVDRLEAQGVAERVPHPSDRRRTIVRLTERGHQIATESERRLADALRLLDPGLLAGFAGGLALVADDLDGLARRVTAGQVVPVSTRALPAA